MIDRVIVIPESEFNIPNLERMASAFISQKMSKTKLLLLRVFVSERPAIQYLCWKSGAPAQVTKIGGRCTSFERSNIQLQKHWLSATQPIKAYRDAKGFVGRMYCRVKTPLSFRLEIMSSKIVYIGTNDVPPYISMAHMALCG
ncbi:MAG: hypothetical protein U0V70_15825 [Terriglobia bacterium]